MVKPLHSKENQAPSTDPHGRSHRLPSMRRPSTSSRSYVLAALRALHLDNVHGKARHQHAQNTPKNGRLPLDKQIRHRQAALLRGIRWYVRRRSAYGRLVTERVHRLTDEEYLNSVEVLAKAVVEEALAEGWLRFQPDLPDSSPLQRAVNELARNLRYVHSHDDGCLDEHQESKQHMGGPQPGG